MFQQLVLGHDTPGMPQEIDQQIEASSLHGAHDVVTTQLPSIGAQRERTESILFGRRAHVAFCSLSMVRRASAGIPFAVLGHGGFPHLKRRLKHCQSRHFSVIG
jgi:hypothetical protein